MTAIDRKRLRELHSKHAGGEWAMDENDGSFIARDGDTWKHLGETDLGGEQQHLAIEAINALPGLLDELDASDEALKALDDLIALGSRQATAIEWVKSQLSGDKLAAFELLLRTPA